VTASSARFAQLEAVIEHIRTASSDNPWWWSSMTSSGSTGLELDGGPDSGQPGAPYRQR
jgi:hypothetical protein